MQFVDLTSQYLNNKDAIDDSIKRVLKHGKFIMGPEVSELEYKLSEYLNVKNTIGCSSGTDGLIVALMALGITKGDYVITTPFTFIATAEAICMVGATPIFIDIDKETFNIDVDKIESFIKDHKLNIKAILAADMFGIQANYDALKDICAKYNLFLIQDAAQSFGSLYNNNHIGYFADIAVTSFFPSKPLGCYGDGGAIFTNYSKLATRIRSIIQHGKGTSKYHNVRLGMNARLDTIQAAILLEKLRIFDFELIFREGVARMYDKRLNAATTTPFKDRDPANKSAWAQYSILTSKRDEIKDHLAKSNIPTNIYYPIPLHLQPIFSQGIHLPVAEKTAKDILSLPMSPYLKEYQVDYMCNLILEVLGDNYEHSDNRISKNRS